MGANYCPHCGKDLAGKEQDKEEKGKNSPSKKASLVLAIMEKKKAKK